MPARSRKHKGRFKRKSSIYKSLPRGHFTRVLILEPGNDNQMISGKLETVNVDEYSDFEAISYAWGSKKKRRPMRCNGVAMRITQNLFEALCRLRHPSERRTLWADAICINQDDTTERGHQVAFMSRIYSRARRVLIHIAGDDQGCAAHVASLVADVDCMVRNTMKDIGPGTHHFPWPDPNVTRLAEDSRCGCLAALSRRPWFSRGWVIQEAGLAQDATIIWGAQTMIEWQAFMRCLIWFNFRSLSVLHHHNILVPMCHDVLYFHRNPDEVLAYGRRKFSNNRLLGLIVKAGRLHFADPRDRIFALAGLDRYLGASGGVDHLLDGRTSMKNFEPDYNRSVEDIYTGFASHYLQTKSIEILECVRHDSLHSLFDASVPSWVPRWGRSLHWTSLFSIVHPIPLLPERPPEAMAGQHIFLGRFVDEDILVVRGVFVDTIEEPPIKLDCKQALGNPSIDVFAAWSATLFRHGSSHPDFYHLAERFMNTLTRGRYSGDWNNWREVFEKWYTFLAVGAEDSRDYWDGGELEQFTSSVAQKVIDDGGEDQCIFSTSRGYLGNGPRSAQEGDLICIIFGCSRPFILRITDKGARSGSPLYRLVGPAYIAGTHRIPHGSGIGFYYAMLGDEQSKDWVEWGLQEQDIHIC